MEDYKFLEEYFIEKTGYYNKEMINSLSHDMGRL